MSPLKVIEDALRELDSTFVSLLEVNLDLINIVERYEVGKDGIVLRIELMYFCGGVWKRTDLKFTEEFE